MIHRQGTGNWAEEREAKNGVFGSGGYQSTVSEDKRSNFEAGRIAGQLRGADEGGESGISVFEMGRAR